MVGINTPKSYCHGGGQFVRVMQNMAKDLGFFSIVWCVLVLAFRCGLFCCVHACNAEKASSLRVRGSAPHYLVPLTSPQEAQTTTKLAMMTSFVEVGRCQCGPGPYGGSSGPTCSLSGRLVTLRRTLRASPVRLLPLSRLPFCSHLFWLAM